MRAGDEELHALLDRGDLRDAGTWLVEGYAHEVLGLCAAMIRDRIAAEDLAQDVFSRAFSGLGTYRREASSRTWLLAIARNRCIDHLRANGRAPFTDAEPDEAPDEAPLPLDLLSRRADVTRALAELSEGERALVVLRYRHGLSYDELANVFGLKSGTTRMRVSRALNRMRAALEAEVAPSLLEGMLTGGVAAPEAARSGYGALADEEAGTREEEEADDLAAASTTRPPPAQRRARRSLGAPVSRPSVLSRIFGGKKKSEPDAPEEATEAPPSPKSPPAPPSRRSPAPASPPAPRSPAGPPAPPAMGAPMAQSAAAESSLAAFLRAVDPTAPESFTKRLFDLAARL